MVEFNGFKIDLLSLIPKCEICQHNFDTFLRSPQILPCSHTFCLMCITKKEQRKKRRCRICNEKYAAFRSNTAYLVLITSVHLYRQKSDQQSLRCEECGTRQLINSLRRCVTCEIQIQKLLNHTKQTCCICLECCVDQHNGHDLRRLMWKTNKKRFPESVTKIVSFLEPKIQSQTLNTSVTSSFIPSPPAASEPTSCFSTCRIKSSVFKRKELRSESLNTHFRRNTPHGSQQLMHTAETLFSQRSFDSKSSGNVICIKNVNYSNQFDSGILTSPSSEDNSTSTKPSNPCLFYFNDKDVNEHIPNMPRNKHSRKGRKTQEDLKSELDTDLEDELLPLLGRRIKQFGVENCSASKEQDKFDKLVEDVMKQRSTKCRSSENVLLALKGSPIRCRSYENIFERSESCKLITQSVSCT